MAGTDFSHLTSDELINGIKALNIPDYIRTKSYGVDVRETLAQMTEMLMQLAYNQGMSPQEAQDFVYRINNKINKGNVTMNDLTQEVKEAMTGGAVAVVGVDAVGNENIKDGSVTPLKTNFLTQSSPNLFNPSTWKSGGYISTANGNVVTTGGYGYSDYIEVEPNTTYSFNSSISGKAFYDANKSFIVGGTLTSPSNAKYIRVSTLNPLPNNLMLVKGSTLPDKYVPYHSYNIKDDIDIHVNKKDIAFISNVMSPNLFNPSNWTPGGYISVLNGNVVEISGYGYSDYIEVEPNVTYSLSFTEPSGKAFYDANKVFIVGGTLSAPSNAKYFRFSTLSPLPNDVMLVKGAVLPSKYIPYKIYDVFDEMYVQAENIIGLNTNDLKSSFEGKKWVAIGDSISQYKYTSEYGTNFNWIDVVANKLGITNVVRCVKEGLAMFDFLEIMSVSGTTDQDIIDADLITVSLGQNNRVDPLGSAADAPTQEQASFAGNTKWVAEYILNLNPTATIVFITPTPSKDRQARLTQQADIIKDVADNYSVPVFDLNRVCGFNQFNYTNYYVDAWVHPNANGNLKMGNLTAKYLMNL